jgi:essential nuclear protein 1
MAKRNIEKKNANTKFRKGNKLMNVRITKRRAGGKNTNTKRGKFNFKKQNQKVNNPNKKNFENKKKSKTSSLVKNEEEIEEIEKENELFYNDAYDAKEDIYEEEWGDVDNTNTNTNNTNNINKNLSNALFKKMNEVEEPKLDPRIIQTYTLLGDILKTYTSGKLPKAFNILPVTENWEELVELTKPETWSPQAMFEGTKMFCSNLNALLAEKFYAKVLVPAIRQDIKKNKKLNIHYYNCLRKSIFKPAGFFKGIIIPMSDNTTTKEASIIGSIIKKCSIPSTHSSACIMKLMEKCSNKISMGALFFTKMLLLKKYALPTQVKEALANFFYKYVNYYDKLPVLWHQALLIFVQIYKLDLTEEEKQKLKELVQKQNHYLISEDISRELNYKPPQINFTTNGIKNTSTSMMTD